MIDKTRLDFRRLTPMQIDDKMGFTIGSASYNQVQGKLDAYADIFDYINNKTDRDLNSILVFITDRMIKNHAENLTIRIIKE
tara:strand:- start:315 stop:560 length:246 start_codon:yes stop_codon:yes gene_type:complete